MRHQVMVILFPFAVLALVDAVFTTLQKWGAWNLEVSPLKLAVAATMYHNPEWIVFSVIGVLIVISFVAGYWQVVKNELD